jgi:Arc/MetJ family transcription regulator
MRTTVAIDDDLFAKAKEFAGVNETAAVIREALRTFVEVEAGRRLARMGGTMAKASAPRRRRPSR